MRLELVSTLTETVRLKDDWNRLADGHPMRSWEWAYSWAENMLGDNSLIILVGRDSNGTVTGIAPFYRQFNWLRGDIIHFIGDQLCCTDYATLLTTDEWATQFVSVVARWLDERAACNRRPVIADTAIAPVKWYLMRLEGVSQTDPVANALMREMADLGCLAKARSNSSCWRVALPPTWEQYVAGLSKSQRRNVRMVERRLLDADGVSIKTATDQASLELGMRYFRELHQRRWESEGKPGCFGDPMFADFLNAVAPRMLDAGALRLLWVEKDGQPIAADFTLLSDDTSFGYQMGLDPDLHDQQIGRATLVAAMRATHASGRKAFDFLRGNEQYKSRWQADEFPLVDIEIVPNRNLPRIRQNLFVIGRSVKRRIGTALPCG